MLIKDIFNRFEKEWHYLEKRASQDEERVLSKIPFHDILKDHQIVFSILKKSIPDFKRTEINQSRFLNKENYKYIVKFELNNSAQTDYKKKELFQGLSIEFERKNNNVIIAILTSEHKNRPQFSLFLSYLAHELSKKEFFDALEDTFKYLKNYWSISTLSKNFQLGLFGELHILEMLINKIGWEKAVNGWKGPDAGLHDFIFNKTLIEIKTTESDPPSIRIENPAQLFSPDNHILFLNVCHAEIGNGIDIVQKAKQLQNDYDGYDQIDNSFKQKLINIGFFNHLITGGLLKINIAKSTQVKLMDSTMVLSKELIDSFPKTVKNIKYHLDYSLFDSSDTNVEEWLG
jgi:hypothetical protein